MERSDDTGGMRAADEANLVRRLADREEAVLDEIQSNYRPLLLSVIRKVIPDETEAADVLQEVLLQLWEQGRSYDPSRGRFTSWMGTIARRRAIDHVRKLAAYRRATDRLEFESPQAGLSTMPDENEVATRDVCRILEQKLDQLPDVQREAVRLSFIEGLSQREIARRIRKPLSTVKTRIALGLGKLFQSLGHARNKVM